VAQRDDFMPAATVFTHRGHVAATRGFHYPHLDSFSVGKVEPGKRLHPDRDWWSLGGILVQCVLRICAGKRFYRLPSPGTSGRIRFQLPR